METLRNIGDWTLWKWARLVFLLVLLGKPGAGQAGAPAVVEFRGQVLVDGVPFTGTGQFLFALVDRAGAFMVLEPPNGPIRTPISLPVSQGNYTVRFGVDTLPIPQDALSDREGLALRVWFGDGAQELQQILPDYPFDSVAYAQWSAGASFAVRASHAAIAAQAEAYAGPVAAGQITGLINDGLLSRNIARLDSSPVFTGTVQAGGFEGPGSFRWVDRASPELMASPQTGYVALREDGPMVVTVPTTARAGDIIRVMGAGAGGWWIRDGSGALLASRPPGSRWTDRGAPFNGPSYDWRAAAVSADGTKLVLCSYGGQVFTSSDGGVEWTLRMPVQFWVSAAASRDGARWAACAHNGPVYLSTDGGMNWAPVTGNQAWRSVAISTDGNIIAACVDGGQIHISKDSGETWSTRGGQLKWSSVAVSGAGLNMVACVDGGQVHTSSDGGDTWVARGTVQAWKSVASSVDGSRLVACVEGGHVYTSNDAGVTWVARGEARAWKAVACSGSGERLIAAVAGGGVHTSMDGGETWVAHEGVSGSGAIACSRDGATFVAAGDGVIRVSHGAMGADEMAELIYTTTGSWLVKVQAALDRNGSVGMDRIPDLSAAKITSGTFRPDLIPGLDAGHIRTGVLDPARIPSIGPEKLVEVPASKVTGTLTEAQLPASVARLDSSASFSGSVAAGVFRGQGTMPWVGVGEATQVVSPNTGYLALRETGPVVFTLPASAAVGDVIRFVGVGEGGWRVNDSRGGTKLPEPPGVHWAQRLGPAGWRQMACSADGSKVIALNPGVEIQVSTDGGLRWNARSIEGWPGAVTLSADGSRVIVCDPLSGFAYVSINLGGNWVKRPIPREIQGPSPVMASSASGMKVTVCSGSYMAHSEDGGLTWRVGLMANSGIWASVAASADGMYWVAAASGGSVYTSSNGGTNWAPVPALPTSASWTSVASSSDGRRLIACAKGEPLRFSADAGATWGTRETARNWTSVSSAGDGSTVIACAEGGVMVVSADFGETWALRDGGQNWRSALVSADGKRWFAMAAEGDVHSVYTSPSPARPAGVVGEFHYTGAGGWVHAEYATLDASGTLDRRLIPTLGAENLAGLPASKITSGVLDPNRIPGMDAIKLTSGSLLLARIPALPANQITSGVFDPSRIPPLPANQVTSGVFDPSRIPPLDASRFITGVLNINRIPPLSAQNVRSGVFGGDQIPVTLSGRRNFLGNLLVAPAGFTPPSGTGSSPGGEPPLVLVRDQASGGFGYCLGINNRDGTPWWRVGADDGARFSIGASGLRDYDISIDRNSGNVGIGRPPGDAKLSVVGVVLAMGGVRTSSDARLKTAIAPLAGSLDAVERLRGVSFEWRAVPGRGVPVEGRQLGFLAQEVQSVLPELVKEGADGHLSVNYDGVIPVLAEAIKELRHGYEAELREKEARLAALEKRLERLEGRLTSGTIAAPDTGNSKGN